MFKPKARSQNSFKRSVEDAETEEAGSAVVRPNKMSKTTAESAAAPSKVDEDVFAYKSSRKMVSNDVKAFATNEMDTAADQDARAIAERNIQISKELKAGTLDEKVYRGAGAYKKYIDVREGAISASKYTGAFGPVRASATNVRQSVRFDYQPDVCKDYKETGFCGYGDSCKFMHDRGDYKTGWQIEKEWDKEQALKRKKARGDIVEEEEEDEYEIDEEDGLPFACFICRNDFTDPVVTKCGHYFCQKCALDAYMRNSKCQVCQRQTMGIFNVAHKLIEQLAEKRKRQTERKRPAPVAELDLDGENAPVVVETYES
eukprot:GILJ01005192.1.p1 GENE.GILJ01005192.1~~GILJ01005192.1.p1  ORF type:complete len:346 (-),score=51.86 GILJ01005192.1:136-1083(-)